MINFEKGVLPTIFYFAHFLLYCVWTCACAFWDYQCVHFCSCTHCNWKGFHWCARACAFSKMLHIYTIAVLHYKESTGVLLHNYNFAQLQLFTYMQFCAVSMRHKVPRVSWRAGSKNEGCRLDEKIDWAEENLLSPGTSNASNMCTCAVWIFKNGKK